MASLPYMKTQTPPRKVSMYLPPDLLEQAMKASKKNLTETVRQGLKLVATSATYDQLLKYQGKVDLKLNLPELRKDR